MSAISTSVSAFLGALGEVTQELERFESGMDERREQIRAALTRLRERCRAHPSRKMESRFAQIVAECMADTAVAITDWLQSLDTEVRAEEFVRSFDRSLIVLVYGNVNSGKSSLGNFLAGHGFENSTANPYAGFTPTFLRYVPSERRQEPIAKGAFETKATECTDSIQSFTLGGMSWVDTPGLGSMTEANGALAREYAAAAELVVCITDSDSPLRAREMERLQPLIGEKKPMLMVVSKFDRGRPVYDEDDNFSRVTYEPKPPLAREQQREWIEAQISASGLDQVLADREYVFVSTRLAEQALTSGDEACFAASGMPELYALITRTLRQGPQELKRREPRRRFNALVSRLIGSKGQEKRTVSKLRSSLREGIASLEAGRQELLALSASVAARAKTRCKARVEQLVREEEERVQQDRSTPDTQARLTRAIQDEVARALSSVLSEEVGRVLKDTEASVREHVGELTGVALPPLEERFHKLEVEDVSAGKKGTAVGALVGALGVVALAAAGIATGGVALTALGTLVPMVTGAVGEAVGQRFAGKKQVRVRIGTNADSILDTLFGQLEKAIPDHAGKALRGVADAYFVPRQDALRKTVEGLDSLERELEALRFDDA